jgi:hypothetical protein
VDAGDAHGARGGRPLRLLLLLLLLLLLARGLHWSRFLAAGGRRRPVVVVVVGDGVWFVFLCTRSESLGFVWRSRGQGERDVGARCVNLSIAAENTAFFSGNAAEKPCSRGDAGNTCFFTPGAHTRFPFHRRHPRRAALRQRGENMPI